MGRSWSRAISGRRKSTHWTSRKRRRPTPDMNTSTRISIWPLWVGALLSVAALLSYPLLFVRWPVTRDVPWVNLLMFALSAALVLVGLRRAFRNASRKRKIGASLGAFVGVVALVLFVLVVFVGGRRLPSSQGAPKVGQKAPDFQLSDATGKKVTLSELLTDPLNGRPPKGVLLVFYRGYW